MWVSRYKVENLSSFRDSGWIDLEPGFNLLIGQNNSGKSALLKAFHAPLPNNPHKNASAFRGTDLRNPRVEFEIAITVNELRERFRTLGITPTFPAGEGEREQSQSITNLLADPSNLLQLRFERTAGNQTTSLGGAALDGFRHPTNPSYYNVVFNENRPKIESRGMSSDNLWSIFKTEGSGSYFYFDAQRLNVSKSGLDSPHRLHPNARNLPAVLAFLQGSRKPLFDLIESHVLDIIPGIARVTVTPVNNEFEILIWPERDSMYEELAFSLEESGTGVGQLIAIITAVVTSDQSIILVDEINSFLHPSSVKKLLSLFRSDYSHHQYIISTHSADVISGSDAERIYLVSKAGFESSVSKVSLEDAAHAREIASTLGFSMMDVFGHDRIIWVEGPTEEICFQYQARHLGVLKSAGVGFASVASTDAFSGRGYGRSVAEIYERAGKRLSPLLRGMAFGLDRERLSDDAVAKLERSHRKLRFLPRRCIECYLLDTRAIAAVLSELDDRDHLEPSVLEALNIGGDREFGAPSQWNSDLKHAPWLKRVDAAKLLHAVFQRVTESRVEYRKTRDAISLLKWINENNPEGLSELYDFLRKLFEIAQRDTPP